MSPHDFGKCAAAIVAAFLIPAIAGCAERPQTRSAVLAPLVIASPSATPSQIAEQKRADMRLGLQRGDLKMSEINGHLVLADVVFDETSWFLSNEAIARLDPLIAYLRASPGTRVKIEGFADDGGSSERNQQLSLDRAQYVERVLKVSSSTRNAVDSFGVSPGKPGARYTKGSGKARDRRVEITLLEPSLKEAVGTN